MPGYVLVNMEMTDDAWGLVKNTPGVTGFVGSRNKPVPLSKPEVDRLLHRETAERPRTQAQFSIGESVKVISGPALGLLRRDRRDQRGRRQTQGAGLDLRPRDAGRGRLRPGQEDLALPSPIPWQRKSSPSSSCRSRRATPTRRRRSALRWASTASTSWTSAKRSTPRPRARAGTIIPVEITVYEDRSFTFITKTPPAAILIKEAIGIKKGSGEPHVNKVGTISMDQVRQIAERKMPDLNANDLDAASKIIAGTARSMGVDVK